MTNQEGDRQDTSARRRSLAWLVAVAIGAAALMVVVGGGLQAARPAAAETREARPAIEAVVVSPIDHSGVQSIDASAEPDSTGASIATYGP